MPCTVLWLEFIIGYLVCPVSCECSICGPWLIISQSWWKSASNKPNKVIYTVYTCKCICIKLTTLCCCPCYVAVNMHIYLHKSSTIKPVAVLLSLKSSTVRLIDLLCCYLNPNYYVVTVHLFLITCELEALFSVLLWLWFILFMFYLIRVFPSTPTLHHQTCSERPWRLLGEKKLKLLPWPQMPKILILLGWMEFADPWI